MKQKVTEASALRPLKGLSLRRPPESDPKQPQILNRRTTDGVSAGPLKTLWLLCFGRVSLQTRLNELHSHTDFIGRACGPPESSIG